MLNNNKQKICMIKWKIYLKKNNNFKNIIIKIMIY